MVDVYQSRSASVYLASLVSHRWRESRIVELIRRLVTYGGFSRKTEAFA